MYLLFVYTFIGIGVQIVPIIIDDECTKRVRLIARAKPRTSGFDLKHPLAQDINQEKGKISMFRDFFPLRF